MHTQGKVMCRQSRDRSDDSSCCTWEDGNRFSPKSCAWTSGCQDGERICCVVSSHGVCGNLLQQLQDTNTLLQIGRKLYLYEIGTHKVIGRAVGAVARGLPLGHPEVRRLQEAPASVTVAPLFCNSCKDSKTQSLQLDM